MPKYLFAYHGADMPENREEGIKHMTEFLAWIEALGDTVVNPGMPLGISKTVKSGGMAKDTGTNRLTGFSMVRTDSMDAALEIARDCPYLNIGTIEVAEVKEM
jgi:hypothetical protein